MRDSRPDLPDLERLIGSFAGAKGGLLPALHAIQHDAGFIDTALLPKLADTFNLSVAEVHGVLTFYKDFRTAPPKGPVLQVCRGEACQARGGHATWERALDLGPGVGVEVQEVFCLGLCAGGPSVRSEGRLRGGVTEDIVPTVLADLHRSESTRETPQRPSPDRCDAPRLRVFVPRDAAARAAGADDVAAALAVHPDIDVVRNGSRGMLWLEPLIEVETPGGRVAFGPVSPSDVASLLPALRSGGGAHPLHLGLTDELPWMRRQTRLTFARVGVVDPRSPKDHLQHGGTQSLRRALAVPRQDIVQAIVDSGLRGRGGAAFPAGIKWRTVEAARGGRKHVVCNADEGDSGTFADRMLLEGDPFLLLEGMAIAGLGVGASQGWIYLRSEYPDAAEALRLAIEKAEEQGWLGPNVLGSDFSFTIELRIGAGAYICGEETALLESLEGRRGQVRAKPPLPAHEGLWGEPTLVHNVLSLAAVPGILEPGGAQRYAALGVGRSRGTQVFQLAGNVARGGVLELPFGLPLHELIDDLGGGTQSGRPWRAAQIGGPLGAYVPASQAGTPLEYEALAQVDAMLGHGGVVVFDDRVDMRAQARFAFEFCAAESCGKCTPCRIGSTRGVELIDRIAEGTNLVADLDLVLELCDVMQDGSLCAMGGLTPLPVRSALRHFPEDFQPRTALSPTESETQAGAQP